MANFHLEVKVISRGRAQSITSAVSYISGRKLFDAYKGTRYYHSRKDVLYCEVFQPYNAPAEFHNLQYLCNAIDGAEKRYDSRTGRVFIGSLPNELPVSELISIVHEFVQENFVKQGLCAVAAIHQGQNRTDPSRNNPHVHIITSTRTVGPEGFSPKKDREYNQRKYVRVWRESWAHVQNLAYERNGLDIRVSHESLEVQGVRREPAIHLSRIDWQKEHRGERTPSGDRKRAIRERNRQHQRNPERELEIVPTR
ncbi:hypothetical protein D7X33_03740 [Butyricicoccus sp. 1XD8-22]|nr:hypothetical protein D7X33_03740 [Butyricicoccus sp. 1XD8-22]